MKKNLLLLLIAATFVFASCGASRFFSRTAPEISPIALVEPYSYLTDAVDVISTFYREAPSRINQRLVTEIVGSMGLPIEKTVAIDYKYDDPRYGTAVWTRRLIDTGAGAARNLKIPADMRKAVQDSGCRYGLIISDVGFVKNADELALEQALDVSSKIADYIMNGNISLYSDTESHLNSLAALVFDSETGEVVWFGSRPRTYYVDPLDPAELGKQIGQLFKDFK